MGLFVVRSAQRAHSKLQKPPSVRGSPRRGGRRDQRASEGAMCGRHAAVQFGAARGGSPPGQRSGGFVSL
jgi:hypothetical protein